MARPRRTPAGLFGVHPEARAGRASAALAALALSGCASIPGFSDPRLSLSPRYFSYLVTGRARMQSVQNGVVTENAPVDMAQFGQSAYNDEYGGVLEYGDGFSGVELEYQQIALFDTTTGVLTSDFGDLPRGATVNSELDQDEYRASYVAQFFGHEFDLDETDYVTVRAGAGLALVHREGEFKVYEDPDNSSRQSFGYRDAGVPYLALRAGVEFRNMALRLDWDYNPDLTFGGDLTGHLQDVQLLGRYTLDAQHTSILAGYRWSDVKASGTDHQLRYDMDIRLQGFILGLAFEF